MRGYTEQTKLDLPALLQELTKVREQGFALDLAEHVAGLGSIAYPIRTMTNEVNDAVGVTGPFTMIIERNFENHCKAIDATALRWTKLPQLRGAAIS